MASCLSEAAAQAWLKPKLLDGTTLLLLEDTLHATNSGCLQDLELHSSSWESGAVGFGLVLSWPTDTTCRYWSSSAHTGHAHEPQQRCRIGSSKVDATYGLEALILLSYTHHPWK